MVGAIVSPSALGVGGLPDPHPTRSPHLPPSLASGGGGGGCLFKGNLSYRCPKHMLKMVVLLLAQRPGKSRDPRLTANTDAGGLFSIHTHPSLNLGFPQCSQPQPLAQPSPAPGSPGPHTLRLEERRLEERKGSERVSPSGSSSPPHRAWERQG